MGRKKANNTKSDKTNSNNTPTIVAVIGLVGTLITAYFGFQASIKPTELIIGATRTADSFQSQPVDQGTTPAAQSLPNVYIADWESDFTYDSILLHTTSCKDDEQFSNILGTKPKYWVFYQTDIWLTFVNSQDTPNGIVKIEPNYINEFAKGWKLATWYITMYDSADQTTPVKLPVELPPKTPRKWYFRAINVVETTPEVGFSSFYEYGEKLSPLDWTFTIANQEQVIHTSDLFTSIGDIGDGKFNFEKNCKDVLPEWPNIGIPGRQINQ